MQVVSLSNYQNYNFKQCLEQIPLFSYLLEDSESELNYLLEYANVIDLEHDEVIVRKDTLSSCFYILLEGSLNVFGKMKPSSRALSQISGVQLVGVLGAINCDKRTATLAGAPNEKTKVLAIDYSIFGDLSDFSNISLTTKLKLFRNVVSTTRRTLEIYRKTNSNKELDQKLAQLPPLSVNNNTVEELELLATQAKEMGRLLESWNKGAKANILIAEQIQSVEDGSLLGNAKTLFSKMMNK